MAGEAVSRCPDGRMSSVVATIGADEARGTRDLEVLLREYPDDARLHFLKGSLLAGRRDYDAARVSMRHAVDLSPDYAVARFQLGFLLLTSGEPYAAQEVWGPLHSLSANNYMHLFVRGLCHLIRDEFSDTVRLLEGGIARNNENPAMNRDMQLIIDEVRGKMHGDRRNDGPLSPVDFLLQQAAIKPVKH